MDSNTPVSKNNSLKTPCVKLVLAVVLSPLALYWVFLAGSASKTSVAASFLWLSPLVLSTLGSLILYLNTVTTSYDNIHLKLNLQRHLGLERILVSITGGNLALIVGFVWRIAKGLITSLLPLDTNDRKSINRTPRSYYGPIRDKANAILI
jgi:hypothetical protein